MSKENTRRRKALFERQGGVCHYCEGQMTMRAEQTNTCTVDHIKPRSRGGTAHFHNVVGACWACNTMKGDMDYREFMALREDLPKMKHGARKVAHFMAMGRFYRKAQVKLPDGPWTRKIRPVMPDEPRATAKLGEFFPPELLAMADD